MKKKGKPFPWHWVTFGNSYGTNYRPNRTPLNLKANNGNIVAKL